MPKTWNRDLIFVFTYLFIHSLSASTPPPSLPSGLLQPLQARLELSLSLCLLFSFFLSFSDLASFSVIFFFFLFSSALWASWHFLTSFWFGRQISLRLFVEESGEPDKTQNGIKCEENLRACLLEHCPGCTRHARLHHGHIFIKTYVCKNLQGGKVVWKFRVFVPIGSPSEWGERTGC